MRTAATCCALFILIVSVTSCNDDNQRSYSQYYHPNPGAIFASNSPVGKARNPKHGQPGHRCDIAEGDPLPVSASLPVASTPFPSEVAATGNPATSTSPFSSTENNLAMTGSLNPEHGKPGHRCDIPVGSPLNATLPNNNITNGLPAVANQSGALNPAHGQPGHRCDLAVGAPLNSAPAKPVNTNAAIQASAPSTGNLKLNPSHGQPGHRCDIAVGAPLNSAPAKSNSTPTVTPTTPIVAKTLSAEDSLAIWNALPTDSTGAKLNPSHGQPGHDCSIAVGKPLKSKS